MHLFYFRLIVLFAVALAWLLPHHLRAEGGKLNIAVLDLESKAISTAEAATVTDELRSQLLKTELFNIIERAKVNEVLMEQGLQATDLCNTRECYVEVGQMMGVEKLIVGNIGRLGGLFVLSVRLIDVETGRINIDISDKYEGRIEQVLTMQVPRVVRKLQDEMARSHEFRQAFGTLSVTTNTGGAAVYIDGVLAGRTPLTNAPAYGNTPEVQVQLDGYRTVKQKVRFMKKGEHHALTVVLTTGMGHRWAPVWRSALLPGWGQLRNRHTLKGTVFSAGQVVGLGFYAIALLAYQNSAADYTDAQKQYSAALAITDISRYKQLRDEYYQTAQDRRTLLYVAGGTALSIYALNVADAFFFERSNTAKTAAHIELTPHGLWAGLSFPFYTE